MPWIMMRVPYEAREIIQIFNGSQQPFIHGKIVNTYQKDTKEA
jgi:hypothetical protein